MGEAWGSPGGCFQLLPAGLLKGACFPSWHGQVQGITGQTTSNLGPAMCGSDHDWPKRFKEETEAERGKSGKNPQFPCEAHMVRVEFFLSD